MLSQLYLDSVRRHVALSQVKPGGYDWYKIEYSMIALNVYNIGKLILISDNQVHHERDRMGTIDG
jgi:hypothetical protein